MLIRVQSRLESVPLFTLQVFRTFISIKVQWRGLKKYHQSTSVLNLRSRSVSGTLAGIPDTSINPLSTDDSSIHFDILGFITGWLSDISIQQSQDPQVRFLTWSCFQDPQPAGNCPRVCPQIQTPQNPP